MTESAQRALSDFIWANRYRNELDGVPEASLNESWERVARAAAAVESDPAAWEARFLDILRDHRFLPGGRILAGAGATRQVTLCNCFVSGRIEDSIEGIFESLQECAVTMQQGGGIGCDFSSLRPRGWPARTTGAVASGPVSFMHIWDAACAAILAVGPRHGAMMGTLRCDHPDIEEFIAAAASHSLFHFNLSVLVTDAFMEAVKADGDWELKFAGRVAKSLRARELWQRLCTAADEWAEPGLLFIDRINKANNLGYCETLTATSSCAEAPLPPRGACVLGAVNLTQFVIDPFGAAARVDHASLRSVVEVAVRFLDNALEISRFPFFRQRQKAHDARRLGLGITGLADALAMLRLRYDSSEGRSQAENILALIRDAAYAASVSLATEKGSFPLLDRVKYSEQPFIRSLPGELREAIRSHGIRNSHLLALAPCNTISLLAGNVSNGIEPIFGLECFRRVRDSKGNHQGFQVSDFAYSKWRQLASPGESLPDYLTSSGLCSASDHLLMQATLQALVDGGVSKSVPLEAGLSGNDVSDLLEAAFDLQVKGCTIFRPNARALALQRAEQLREPEAYADEQPCTRNRASD